MTLYGYVVIPNHIHLLWYIEKQNGKESTAASFTKFTTHQFRKALRGTDTLSLDKCEKDDRRHQFWKRDPLAVAITTEAAFLQKLDYIHNNPVRENWKLCTLPEEYHWSSARFYW